MSITFISLIICVSLLSIAEYLITKKVFTPITILSWPFVVVIILNSTLGRRLGFYAVSEDTISQILFGIVFFSIGSIAADLIKMKKQYYRSKCKENNIYDINNIYIYVTVIVIITLIRLIYYFKKFGVANFIANDGMNGILMSGIFCHFLLTTFPLVPILVSAALREKKKRYYIPAVMIIVLVYFTFVKYHIISLVLITIIYLNIENPKRLKKTIPVLIVLPIVIFFINYLSNFKARGISADGDYLTKHLINYICGGVIYDSVNPTFTYHNFGLVKILIMIIMAVPNLVLNLLFNTQVYQFEQIPFVFMGASGEYGNVINTISFLFSSQNYLGTFILLASLGFFIGIINVNKSKNYALISSVYAFTFLSFYATFLVLTPPWEIIIYSIFVPRLFKEKRRVDKDYV